MGKNATLDIDGKAVPVTNLDKIYYPKAGFTKGEMLEYYIKIAPVLLPHLKGRPLTMKRYPNGVEAPFFYEKQCPKPKPPFVETHQVKRHHEPGSIQFCLVNNLPTLVWAANLGDLELHTFLSKAPNVHKPTEIVFDLDPGAPADAVQCAQVALWIRDMFENLGLKCFIKSSGSKGMQLYVPLNTPTTYTETTPFAKAVAQALEQAHPELVVSDMKKELRKGKVLVDWSQNSETKTTVCVYSLRAKDQPFVSMPLEWSEVEQCLKKKDASLVFFTAGQALKRVAKKGDLFADVLTMKQSIKKALSGLGKMAAESESESSDSDVAAVSRPRGKRVSAVGRLRLQEKNTSRLRGTGDGSISAYNAKRDFTQTAEPSGKAKKSAGKKRLFVIQKHDASHLHYDFRLELDGVLKSWAVPKGPQTDMETKRLAMMVEDHPYDYARFEGTIPEGNYGAGTVMVWDIGTWENLGPETHEGLKKGKLHFQLNGKKLNGEWALVKMHGPRATKGNEWLLLKHGKAQKTISAKQDDTSAISGRSLAQIAGPKSKKWISNRKADNHDHSSHESESHGPTDDKPSFKSRIAALARKRGA